MAIEALIFAFDTPDFLILLVQLSRAFACHAKSFLIGPRYAFFSVFLFSIFFKKKLLAVFVIGHDAYLLDPEYPLNVMSSSCDMIYPCYTSTTSFTSYSSDSGDSTSKDPNCGFISIPHPSISPV